MATKMKTLTINDVTYDITDDSAVSFVEEQSLTEAQKARARRNIGANKANPNICTFLDAYTAWCNGEEFPIAFYGDSTFDGYATTSRDYAFCARLQALLREECGQNATIYNAGASGRSLPFALENFDTYFGENGKYANAKMVGIGFGINDRLAYNTYKEYKDGVYEMLEALITRFFDRGIQPFLVTSQATLECGVGTPYAGYVLRDSNSMNVCANGAKKELAEKYGIPLIDLNAATESFLTNSTVALDTIIADALHFGDIGHEFEAGYLFSKFVPRTICYSGQNKLVLSYANQNLCNAVPHDKLSFGGDFKVYANYIKSDIADTKIFDAYVFNADYPIDLQAFKNAGGATYVKINGQAYVLSADDSSVCTLDLGLHHLEVFTGTSTSVNFNGFVLNGVSSNTGAGDTGGNTESDVALLIDTTDVTATNSNIECGGGFTPAALMFNHNLTDKTTDLSNTTLDSISLNCTTAGTITIGKVDLNEFGSGSMSVINPVSYSITVGECKIDLDGLVIGANETLCFGANSDTAMITYLFNMESSDIPRTQFTTVDNFKNGGCSLIGLWCKVYGRRNSAVESPTNVSLLVDTTGIGGNDTGFLSGNNFMNITPFILLFNHDTAAKTTVLSDKRLASIVFQNVQTGFMTISKINLNEFGSGTATITPCMKKVITSGAEIDLGGLSIGANETIAIGYEGDNCILYYTDGLDSYDNCRFTSYSGFTDGNPSNFALKCKIYAVED